MLPERDRAREREAAPANPLDPALAVWRRAGVPL